MCSVLTTPGVPRVLLIRSASRAASRLPCRAVPAQLTSSVSLKDTYWPLVEQKYPIKKKVGCACFLRAHDSPS